MPDTFANTAALQAHLAESSKGAHLIAYIHLNNYSGMAVSLMLVYNVPNSTYDLDLQWISLGLDFYGDTLQESYQYRFSSLEAFLAYITQAYGIAASDIPVTYQFDQQAFPNPISHAAQKPEFEIAWQQFQKDFGAGKFLDTAQQLIYSSANEQA